MGFDKWMYSTGLSKSSVLKYYGAIEGVLSEWAKSGGITQENILDITNKIEFDALVTNINQLPIFQERNATGHHMYSSALKKYSEFLAANPMQSIDHDIKQILSDPHLDTTEKARLINARIGQGKFRKSLLKHWGKCAVTGVSNTALLAASHIKPWSKSNNSERLDVFNGLLLIPNLDRAFDQGYISFSPNGKILVSNNLSNKELLGINTSMSVALLSEHQPFMKYHRDNVFKKIS